MKKEGYSDLPEGGLIKKAGSSIGYKTGLWKDAYPVRDKVKCTNCLICFGFCPENCIKVIDGKITDADLAFCKGCGICAKECPFDAIKMEAGCIEK